MTYSARVHTGPSLMPVMARRFEEAGFKILDTTPGHLYVRFDSDIKDCTTAVITKLRTHFGHTFGILPKDILVLK